MAMNFLIAKYLKEDINMHSASQMYERWRLTNEKYSQFSRSTFRASRAIIP
jgi:hypothetical protein